MPIGRSDIPELRLETLRAFVTKFMSPPNLLFVNMFGTSQASGSTIKWESQEGTRGMVPFKSPGAPTKVTAPIGIAQHSAEAAFWGEKMYFDEVFLNNLRKEGTENQYLTAQARLAREMAGLTTRCMRRKEWMFSKMITAGSFTYSEASGTKLSVDYSIPSDHIVTLAAASKWNSGNNKDIIGDIIDGKKKISDDCGANVNYAFCNSTTLKYLARDTTIQTLLSKSAFGEGDLFKGSVNNIVGVNPKVVGALLDIPNLIVYDEIYEVKAYLLAAVAASSTTSVTVENPADFVAGGTLRFVDVSAGTWEEETISSVTPESNYVVVSTAPSTSYKAFEDYVLMRKKFIPDDKFIMMASDVDGQKIAEYFEAPFGLNHQYGIQPDTHEEWDPDGIWIRVQDKGLPVLYQRDALYILDVE